MENKSDDNKADSSSSENLRNRQTQDNRAAYNDWASRSRNSSFLPPVAVGPPGTVRVPLNNGSSNRSTNTTDLSERNSGASDNRTANYPSTIHDPGRDRRTSNRSTNTSGNHRSSNNTTINAGTNTSHRPNRRRGHVPLNNTGSRSNASTSTQNQTGNASRNVQPHSGQRYNNQGQPPTALRFRTNRSQPPVSQSTHPLSFEQNGAVPNTWTDQNDGLHLLSNFNNPFLRGAGTDSEPYELFDSPPTTPSAPEISDEEYARQLQLEEWERASDSGHDDPLWSMRHPYDYLRFPGRGSRNFLPQARRPSELGFLASEILGNIAAANQVGQFQSDEGPGARSGLSQRHHRNRGQGRWNSRHRRGSTDYGNPHLMNLAAADITPYILDLFMSYGVPEFEVQNILGTDVAGDIDLNDYESLIALAERVGEVNRGISDGEINHLPTVKHKTSSLDGQQQCEATNEESLQCNICLTDYEDGDQKRQLPCKHEFHPDCVDKWLKTNATCPVCRSEVKMKKSTRRQNSDM